MITWTPRILSGTSLRGYLTGSFPEMLVKLRLMSGQTGETDCGDGKVTVEFIGTLNGQPFTVYDYYGEKEPLHIGGSTKLDLEILKVALADVGVVSDMGERWR